MYPNRNYRPQRLFQRKPLFLGVFCACASMTSLGQTDEEPANANGSRIEEVIVEGRRVTEQLSQVAIDFTRYGTQVQLIDAEKIATGGFTN
ncbi:MAG: hypothetical protein RIC89_17430, partial [Pseudomonadales bacterium]